MVIDNSFLKRHLVDLVHSGVSLEGALATRVQTKDILLGKRVEVDYKTAKIIKNIVVAFRYIYTKGCSSYKEPKTLMYLHVMLSDLVEDYNKESIYQGRLRDFPVSIGGTNYQPPVSTPDISYRRLLNLLSSVDGSVDSILIAYCYLMKYQFFANTNKRTAYTWANLALFQCNTGYFLCLPTKKEGMEKFKDYLLAFYENDRALDRFVSYLKRYYLKEA